MRERWETGSLQVYPGCFEDVTVRGIIEHTPSRFGSDEYPDLEGWVRWEGAKVRVRSAFWCEVLVWEFLDDPAELTKG